MEFYAAVEGYNERLNDEAKLLRFASFRLAECFAGSKAIGSIERFWPMEKPKKVIPLSKEEIADIFKRHNIKPKEWQKK
jgi:hypothetical protein